MHNSKKDILIVGGGHAGGMLAISLRKNNFQGSIAIITDENFLPYQRPPLSKRFLSNDINLRSLFLKTEGYYDDNNIEIIFSHAEKINRDKKNIRLANKKSINYEQLVLATGGTLNKINKHITELPILYLRTLSDAKKIKKNTQAIDSLCIIGAGYIGLEIASALAKKGINITVIESEERVMKRVVCHEVSSFIESKHKEYGVNFMLNSKIKKIKNNNDRFRVTLTDNQSFDYDLVIAGIGIKANTELATECGLNCDNGILVNEYSQTSDPDIFAIGDCSKHLNHFFNRMVRLESVQNAVDQAIALSSYLINSETKYQSVPWFWSEQYNIKLQVVGLSTDYDEYFIKGRIEESKFSVFYFKKDNLIAVDSINSNKDFSLAKKMIGSKEIISKESIKAMLD